MFLNHLRNILTFKTIFVKLKVNYRIKCDLKIEKEKPIKLENLNENQIKRIFKWKNISSRKYEQLHKSLQTYEGLGFKLYQMVESSKQLLLNSDEVLRRHGQLLRVYPKEEVSIPMLKQAEKDKVTESGKSALDGHREVGGSHYKRLMKALHCSEDEFTRILLKNPRLCGTSRKLDLVPKVELLLKNGVDIKMIKKNSFILNNQPYAVIERRLQKMKELNMDIPINIGTLNRTEEVFQSIYNDLSSKESTATFKKCLKILSRLPKFNKKVLHLQKRKIDMLLERGFGEAEIIEQAHHLKQSFEQLKYLVDFSEGFGAPGPPPLKLVLSGENSSLQEHSNLLFVKPLDVVLDCRSIERLPDVIDKQQINYNIKFLRDQAFNVAQISQMPFVLCYPPKHVKLAWRDMVSDERVHVPNAGEEVNQNKLKAGVENRDVRIDKSININGNHSLDDNNSSDDYESRIVLLNVLQYKLEMLPLSEMVKEDDSSTINQTCLISDEIKSDEGIYDVGASSDFKSECPIDFYINEDIDGNGGDENISKLSSYTDCKYKNGSDKKNI